MIKNIVRNCLITLCCLGATSCGYSYFEQSWDTTSSFTDNRSLYDKVVADVQQYRDDSECFESGCHIDIPEDYFKKTLPANFHDAGLLSTAPLVIVFRPIDTIYSQIWYAETQESEDYINNWPDMHPSAYSAREMEKHWFLVTLDWN